ncbi:MAG: hypothetical protein LBB74_02920 [Chitinispirillales bacterium]|jgi:hypothetical protein|nr:hypothetical protein [Chitinispirillales bacterium]
MKTAKRFRLSALAIVSAALLLPLPAQQNYRFRGSEGWGFGSKYEQLFDNYNLKTIVATVVRVDTNTLMKDMSVGLRLIVTEDATGRDIPVHLGPMWYATNQDINFPKGEKVEIRGCRASYMGSPEFIMLVELRSKNRVFRFRDDDGNPFWVTFRNKP